jgi:predicted Zn-dependent peptidase
VGDFNTDELLGKIEELWGHYPRGKDSFELGLVEPEQKEFREVSLEMRVSNSYMLWGFHIPGAAHPDIPVLDVLNTILSDGENSSLYQALKVEKDLALSVSSYVEKRKDPSLLVLDFQMDTKNEKKVVETALRELDKIVRKGVSREELEAAKKKIENGYYFDHQSYIDQAQTLAFFGANADIALESYYVDQILKTSIDDIKRVAGKYLRPTNCTIATVRPEGSKPTNFSEIAGKITFPVVSQEAATTFPARREVLDNGLTFISKPDYSSNTVAIEVYIRGGLLAENEEKNGICNYLSETLLKGTVNKNATQIAGQIDRLGINLVASSHEDYSRLSMLSVPGYLQEGVDLLIEVMTQPSFPKKEISRVRAEILARIKSLPDRSYDLTNKEFAGEIFIHSPYRMPVLGEEGSVSGLTRTDLVNYFESLYVPSNMIITMVGSFTEGDVSDVESKLAGIPGGDHPVFELTDESRQREIKEKEIRLDKSQITFNLGMMGVGVSHDDYIQLKLVERVLSRRLFFKYVYEEGIAYRMWAYLRPRLLSTPFTFEMGVSPLNYSKAKEGILNEIKTLLKYGISKEEFEAAKKNLVTRIYLDEETNTGQASNMAFYEMAGLGYNFLNTIQDRLDFVDLNQTYLIAGRYLTLKRYTLVVVGKTPQ